MYTKLSIKLIFEIIAVSLDVRILNVFVFHVIRKHLHLDFYTQVKFFGQGHCLPYPSQKAHGNSITVPYHNPFSSQKIGLKIDTLQSTVFSKSLCKQLSQEKIISKTINF